MLPAISTDIMDKLKRALAKASAITPMEIVQTSGSVLHLAASGEWNELLEAGESEGLPLEHLVAYEAHLIALLAEWQGVGNVLKQNASGLTPLDTAIDCGHTNAILGLLEHPDVVACLRPKPSEESLASLMVVYQLVRMRNEAINSRLEAIIPGILHAHENKIREEVQGKRSRGGRAEYIQEQLGDDSDMIITSAGMAAPVAQYRQETFSSSKHVSSLRQAALIKNAEKDPKILPLANAHASKTPKIYGFYHDLLVQQMQWERIEAYLTLWANQRVFCQRAAHLAEFCVFPEKDRQQAMLAKAVEHEASIMRNYAAMLQSMSEIIPEKMETLECQRLFLDNLIDHFPLKQVKESNVNNEMVHALASTWKECFVPAMLIWVDCIIESLQAILEKTNDQKNGNVLKQINQCERNIEMSIHAMKIDIQNSQTILWELQKYRASLPDPAASSTETVCQFFSGSRKPFAPDNDVQSLDPAKNETGWRFKKRTTTSVDFGEIESKWANAALTQYPISEKRVKVMKLA